MSAKDLSKRVRALCRRLQSHRTAFTDDDGVSHRVRCPACIILRNEIGALLAASR